MTTLAYTAVARNLSQTQLAALWTPVPLDTDMATQYGLHLSSDVVAPSGAHLVTRTITYASTGGGPFTDPQLLDVLANYYTITFARALSTPVVAAPVV